MGMWAISWAPRVQPNQPTRSRSLPNPCKGTYPEGLQLHLLGRRRHTGRFISLLSSSYTGRAEKGSNKQIFLEIIAVIMR
jgi:hypothetical protein